MEEDRVQSGAEEEEDALSYENKELYDEVRLHNVFAFQ